MRETQYLLIAISRRSKNRPSRILLNRGLLLFYFIFTLSRAAFCRVLASFAKRSFASVFISKGFYAEFVIFSVSVLVHEWCHFSF